MSDPLAARCVNCSHTGHVHSEEQVGMPCIACGCLEFKPDVCANGHTPYCEHQDAPARYAQVGGDHYRKFLIQPWDIWLEYGLDPWTAGVIKYILRAGHKGPKVEDLRKARHYLDRAIEIEEAKDADGGS